MSRPIDAELAAALVRAQFPQWADLVGDLEDGDVEAALSNRRVISRLVREAGGV